jgi:cytochrome c556
MKQIITMVLVLTLNAVPASAGNNAAEDDRINLALTKSEKAEFLAEMRQMLVSIQGIIAGIGEEDRELIISSARKSGNTMARATPDAVRNKLPQSFKEIGGPTHMMFEELVIRAETDDMDMLASYTGNLMQQCVACHAMFRVD